MDIKLDLARLKELSDDLKAIYAEFHGADDFSNTVADATGNDHLHDAVRDFAHAWNEKRPKMADAVHTLQMGYDSVTEHFTKLDTDLAAALEKARADEARPPHGKAL
jgi:hypothetical protein